MSTEDDERDDLDRAMMGRALELARQAIDLGEVPVGTVIVRNGTSSPRPSTCETPCTTPPPMPSGSPSPWPVVPWAPGS